ncbi:VOC family protein [Dendrosporobacter sp. 1207_IL3150]|uniref:VOC family protein n=1 Tax=Dendrosporobacter sp. 1207_IL3150 TaxID=3084054 RepID=UPI002FD96047
MAKFFGNNKRTRDSTKIENIKGAKNIMKIIVTSIFVQDQDKALEFYTETLGFVKKHDVPVGEFRWIALVSPLAQDGTELLLEPDAHPAAKEYQKKIFDDGIPATMFGVSDINKEYKRLSENGVKFTLEPTKMGEVTIAVFDDTCGNLIQIVQQ